MIWLAAYVFALVAGYWLGRNADRVWPDLWRALNRCAWHRWESAGQASVNYSGSPLGYNAKAKRCADCGAYLIRPPNESED